MKVYTMPRKQCFLADGRNMIAKMLVTISVQKALETLNLKDGQILRVTISK